MLYARHKFKAGPPSKSQRQKKNESKALWTATVVCILAYFLFGAGGIMLVLALGTYIGIRLKQTD